MPPSPGLGPGSSVPFWPTPDGGPACTHVCLVPDVWIAAHISVLFNNSIRPGVVPVDACSPWKATDQSELSGRGKESSSYKLANTHTVLAWMNGVKQNGSSLWSSGSMQHMQHSPNVPNEHSVCQNPQWFLLLPAYGKEAWLRRTVYLFIYTLNLNPECPSLLRVWLYGDWHSLVKCWWRGGSWGQSRNEFLIFELLLKR